MYPLSLSQQLSSLAIMGHMVPQPSTFEELNMPFAIWTVSKNSIVQFETSRGLQSLVGGDQVIIFGSPGQYSHATTVQVLRNILNSAHPEHVIGMMASQFKTARGFDRLERTTKLVYPPIREPQESILTPKKKVKKK